MHNQVLSNEYEIALHITKNMLAKGLISEEEFNRIDVENKRTFIEGKCSE